MYCCLRKRRRRKEVDLIFISYSSSSSFPALSRGFMASLRRWDFFSPLPPSSFLPWHPRQPRKKPGKKENFSLLLPPLIATLCRRAIKTRVSLSPSLPLMKKTEGGAIGMPLSVSAPERRRRRRWRRRRRRPIDIRASSFLLPLSTSRRALFLALPFHGMGFDNF